MKANELRIGNLVYISNKIWSELANKPFCVTGINLIEDDDFINSDSAIRLSSGKVLDEHNQASQYIEPIPLTEEWLLRFGFIEMKNKPNYYMDASFQLMISKSGAVYAHDETDGDVFYLKAIRYVHQLQNLYFALTGEELTIDK